MKITINILVFNILFLQDVYASLECKKTEVHISGHSVSDYTTQTGKKVSEYHKNEYCRKSKLGAKNLKFENKEPDNWNFNEVFKAWEDRELNQFFNDGDRLPALLRKQVLEKIFRGEKSIYPTNPAASLPSGKLIILYDTYFQRNDRVRVLGHEMAHLLYWRLSREQKKEFAQISGWNFDEVKGLRTPPKILIYEDSVDGPAEDFANNIEAYYFDRKHLKRNNLKLLKFIEVLEKEMK